MNRLVERDEEEGGEEQEEQDQLDTFREQWKKELKQGAEGKDDEDEQEDAVHKQVLRSKSSMSRTRGLLIQWRPSTFTTSPQARALFLEGVKYEEQGKLFEAIRSYKKYVFR